MQYHKLVSRYTNGMTGETYLESLVNKRGEFTVKYTINKWAYPKDPTHKLFVYNDEDRLNIRVGGSVELYTCEVKNPIEIPKHINLIPVYDHHIEDFWNNIDRFQENRSKFPYYMTIPKHTVWCDAVKLLERIPTDKVIYSTAA